MSDFDHVSYFRVFNNLSQCLSLRMATLLSFADVIVVIAGIGLLCHFIYKRYEPYNLINHSVLLLVVPGLLTFLLLPHVSNVLYAIAIAYSTYFSTLISSILVYRLSPFHPLAKYPGPLMCKVSKIWLTVIAVNGKQHIYYTSLHEKYGDVVRIGPNELSFRDAGMVGPMMGTTGMPKGPFWDGRVGQQVEARTMIGLRDPKEHARRRRPWNRAFSTASIKGYEPIIRRRSQQLVSILKKQIGSVGLSEWMNYFTFDVMNDMAFGGGSEMMRDGDVKGLWHSLERSLKNSILISHLPWLRAFPHLGSDLRAFRNYAEERAATRRAQGSSEKDLFYHLIDEGGVEPNPPTAAEVISDGNLAVVAGSDTTSTVLSNLLWFLMTNPVAFSRLRAEVDQLGDEIFDTTRHAHMPYLNAAINEALRLHPPVVSGSPRAPQIGSGGKVIGPHFLPEGTSALIHFYSLHRDKRHFSPFPDSFLPERWLSAEEQVALEPGLFKNAADVIHNTAAFIPFSYGPSVCSGKNFAYMEMRMVVCLLVRNFDMRFPEGYTPQDYWDSLQDYFVTVRGDLPAILTPRK